mgnify:CR=1 FL=1
MTKEKVIPQIRFSGFTDTWEQRKLSAIADKVTEKNVGLQYIETFTNSAEFGIISQRDFFDHDIAKMSSLGGYYIVRSEDFVYNPRISTSAPVGPINRNKLGRIGVMSPLYTVFRPHDIDTTYLEYFFKSKYWHSFMNFNGDSGARSDRFSIKDSVFFEMPIPIPHIDEQKKIGEYLAYLDRLITLHQRKYDKLTKVKKAMLEKMFPENGSPYPEIRFKGFTDAWEQRKLGDHSEIVAGGTPNTGHPEYWNPKEIPWMSSGEINNKVIYSTDNMISKIGFSNSSAKWVKEKSVLIALAGQGKTRGTVAISEIPLTTNQSIAAIQPDSFLYYKFLFQNLEERYNELREVSSGDGTRGGLNKQIISDLEVLAPEIQEQIKIGDFLCGIDTLITLHQRKLEKLKNIKKACLEKMFV